ncbi:MAG: tetratricopeptide repeat protein, partial [Dehalococcoidia bacterium]
FTGALPEPQVRAFLQRLLPTRADQLAESAVRLAYAGDQSAAEEEFGRALAEDRSHRAANLGLARLLVARGEDQTALSLLAMLPADAEATKLRAEIGLRASATGEDVTELQARISSDPKDVDAHYQIAMNLATQARHAEALEHLLEVVRLDRSYQDDAGRKAMLDIFTLLGDAGPLTQRYRRRLGSLIF